jgi:hypothetical protein
LLRRCPKRAGAHIAGERTPDKSSVPRSRAETALHHRAGGAADRLPAFGATASHALRSKKPSGIPRGLPPRYRRSDDSIYPESEPFHVYRQQILDFRLTPEQFDQGAE